MKKWFLILLAAMLLFAVACKTPENASAQTPQSDAATPAPQRGTVCPGSEGLSLIAPLLRRVWTIPIPTF